MTSRRRQVSPKTREQLLTYNKHILSLLPGYSSGTLADLINPSISAKREREKQL